jgi:hypothetical protein
MMWGTLAPSFELTLNRAMVHVTAAMPYPRGTAEQRKEAKKVKGRALLV